MQNGNDLNAGCLNGYLFEFSHMYFHNLYIFFSHPRQSMRFKPPPPNSDIGWRVEFRPCELQISDYENAAVACFVVLLTRVILSYGYNLLVPISKIDENMKRAQKMDAIVKEKFFFRTNITATCDGTEENEQQAIIEGT